MPTRLTVRGRVQGVGYRQWMCGEAAKLGLAGWVRNRIDGSVEAVLDGPQAAVAAMIQSARRGPPAARVSSVDTEEIEGRFSGFEARPTA